MLQRAALLLLLWVAVIASSVGVVSSSHATRANINALSMLKKEQEALHVEWGQYLLEQSAWSAYSRIEQRAIEELQMRVPAGEQLVMVLK